MCVCARYICYSWAPGFGLETRSRLRPSRCVLFSYISALLPVDSFSIYIDGIYLLCMGTWIRPLNEILSAAKSVCPFVAAASHSRGQEGEDSEGQPLSPLKENIRLGEHCTRNNRLRSYSLNMRSEDSNTVFYSHLARFMNTVTLHMNMFLSNTGFTRRNTVFTFMWLRPRNT